ncbi:MAG TPA: site-specific integrase, partial [Acidimicrobiia bacterium]|nr:site-specific integrase [Acidimicrobiia bacterium]
MSITARTLKSGRTVYDVRLRDPDGRAYKRAFRTKREAEAFEASQRTDRVRGAWIDPRKAATTFAELAARWLAGNPAKRPTSLERDEAIIRLHLLPELGPRAVGSITPADVQRVINGWVQRYAPRTVHRHYDVLSAIMTTAVLEDLVARTPCRGIKLPAVRHEDRHIITAEELVALSDALGPDYGLMAYLGAVLGLRQAECAGLRVGRIDFLRGTLTVAEQLTRGRHGSMATGEPKSDAGRRTLSVPPELMALLASHLARRGLDGRHPDAFVFAAPGGAPLDYTNWRRRIWKPATVKAGLEGLTFHDLRRANATGLVAEGVDVKTAQARLGHS